MEVVQPTSERGAHRLLDRAKWHQPLCSVILTHYNYSSLVEDCLLSLLDQTYQNWECAVVDDCSADEERHRLLEIVERLKHDRIRFIQTPEQLGQIGAFFAGLAETSGEFVVPLDPDDRLDANYLEEMVKAHLNAAVFCPIVSCEQRLFNVETDTVVTGAWKGRLRFQRVQEDPGRTFGLNLTATLEQDPLLYFSPNERSWFWTSTSAIMLRRAALDLLAPYKRLDLRGPALDAYLANGAHFLGGTLFLSKPLVYRGIHDKNWYITQRIVSMRQNLAREGWRTQAPECKRYVLDAMFHNGVTRAFTERYLGQILRTHFDQEQIELIAKTCPEAHRLWARSGPRASPSSRPRQWWRRARRALFGA